MFEIQPNPVAAEIRNAAINLRSDDNLDVGLAVSMANLLDVLAEQMDEHNREPAYIQEEIGRPGVPFTVRPFHPTEARLEVPEWTAALSLARQINGPAVESVPGHELASVIRDEHQGWKATCSCSYWVINRTPGTRVATVARFRQHQVEATS